MGHDLRHSIMAVCQRIAVSRAEITEAQAGCSALINPRQEFLRPEGCYRSSQAKYIAAAVIVPTCQVSGM